MACLGSHMGHPRYIPVPGRHGFCPLETCLKARSRSFDATIVPSYVASHPVVHSALFSQIKNQGTECIQSECKLAEHSGCTDTSEFLAVVMFQIRRVLSSLPESNVPCSKIHSRCVHMSAVRCRSICPRLLDSTTVRNGSEW